MNLLARRLAFFFIALGVGACAAGESLDVDPVSGRSRSRAKADDPNDDASAFYYFDAATKLDGPDASIVDSSTDGSEASVVTPISRLVSEPVVLFLNFDGVTLKCASSGESMDSHDNTVSGKLCKFAGARGALNGTGYCNFWTSFDDCKKDISDKVRTLFAPWGVQVVTSRPPSSTSYFMVVVDGGDDKGTSENGDSLISCDGDPLEDGVAIVFANSVYWKAFWSWNCSTNTSKSLAAAIAHEAGHLLGLFDVDDKNAIMYPKDNYCTTSWTCGRPLVPYQQLGCSSAPPASVYCASEHFAQVIQ